MCPGLGLGGHAPPGASASGVLFPQERLDEFSKQKNEKGEYSVNTHLKNLTFTYGILF